MPTSDILAKREAVKFAYPSPTWANKVMKMTDSQIIAVYLRLKSQNKV